MRVMACGPHCIDVSVCDNSFRETGGPGDTGLCLHGGVSAANQCHLAGEGQTVLSQAQVGLSLSFQMSRTTHVTHIKAME